jgi:protein O-mannosyl-transferase
MKPNKKTQSKAVPTSRFNAWLPAIIIVAIVVIAYVPALKAGFIWDDPRYVVENETLRSAEGLSQIWFDVGATVQYYPLVFTTLWIDYQLWGLNPVGYHLINILLHACSAILLWRILKRLQLPGAWFAAALFALHPVHVESVAWVTERKNVLSALFYLSALLSYLHFLPLTGGDTGKAKPRETGPRKLFVLALVFFICALFSKTVTCTLPVAIGLLLWWKRDRLSVKELLPLVLMLAFGAVAAVMTIYMERNTVRAEGADWAFSTPDRLIIAGRALWFYLAKLLLPIKLTFNYVKWDLTANRALQFMAPISAVAFIAALWALRYRLGKGLATAFLFFGVSLLPALGFVNVYPMRYSFVADHFQYIASIGPLALAAGFFFTRLPRPSAGKSYSMAQAITVAAILMILTGLTWQQTGIYKNREILWLDTLEKNPISFLGHCNLGNVYLESERYPLALEELREAVRLKPDMHEARAGLGKALVHSGQVDEGITQYREAIRLKPDFLWTYGSLADALMGQGKLAEAADYYQQVLENQPDQHAARTNLANALAGQGKLQDAIHNYQYILSRVPGDATVSLNLANAMMQAGSLDRAVKQFDHALRLRPGHPTGLRNMGMALSRLGRDTEAIAVLKQAIAIRPNDPLAQSLLAASYEKNGESDQALRAYYKVLELKPDTQSAREAVERLQK